MIRSCYKIPRRYTYTDLLRTQTDWSYKMFAHQQRIAVNRKIRAYEIAGWPVPLYSAHQVIDNKIELLFHKIPNTYLSSFFACIQTTKSISTGQTNTFVDNGGTARTPYPPPNAATAQLFYMTNETGANNLGTDTGTATVHGNWKPTTALVNSAPTTTALTYNDVSAAFQTVTYNQAQQARATLTYAANATSGNPTVGEVLVGMQCTYAQSTFAVFNFTRLAAGDSLFSAFSVTSASGLTLTYNQNWPNP